MPMRQRIETLFSGQGFSEHWRIPHDIFGKADQKLKVMNTSEHLLPSFMQTQNLILLAQLPTHTMAVRLSP
jgi:hypothetical protein